MLELLPRIRSAQNLGTFWIFGVFKLTFVVFKVFSGVKSWQNLGKFQILGVFFGGFGVFRGYFGIFFCGIVLRL